MTAPDKQSAGVVDGCHCRKCWRLFNDGSRSCAWCSLPTVPVRAVLDESLEIRPPKPARPERDPVLSMGGDPLAVLVAAARHLLHGHDCDCLHYEMVGHALRRIEDESLCIVSQKWLALIRESLNHEKWCRTHRGQVCDCDYDRCYAEITSLLAATPPAESKP